MTDITTTITISLKHDRTLTEAEFKNLVGNIVEHIQEEHREEHDPSDWGFRDITEIRARATHHDEDGSIIEPIHGPVTHHLTSERAYLKRDADKLGLNILIEGGRYIVVRDGQVNAVTSGTFEDVAKALDEMLTSDEFAPL